MGKFESDAREMLRLVGGKENIAALTHCVTRMRFTLVDPSIADVPAIEALKSTKGSFTQAGQFQVIIGNEVGDFYDDFVASGGVPASRVRFPRKSTPATSCSLSRSWRCSATTTARCWRRA